MLPRRKEQEMFPEHSVQSVVQHVSNSSTFKHDGSELDTSCEFQASLSYKERTCQKKKKKEKKTHKQKTRYPGC